MDESHDGQQLRAIFETAIDCLIIINSQGVITKMNQAGEKLFGYEPEELIGQKLNVLMLAPDRENHDRYIKEYERTNEAQVIGKGRTVKAIRKNGSQFVCNLSVSEFIFKSERCYAGIIQDLTEWEKAENKIIELNEQLEEKVKIKSIDLSSVVNKLLNTNKQLEQEIQERKKVEEVLRNNESEIRNALEKEKELNDLKSRFISMASHEFRTPLSTILSSTALIERYIQNGQADKADKHFSRIKYSVKNLTEVLNDFLSLSKIEEGKIDYVPEEFMLAMFCQNLIGDMEALLKPAQRIEVALPEEETQVYLDRKFLRHILVNLFSNAIKYSEEGEEIHFLAEISDGHLRIQLRDEGIGIPENEQKHLFSRFFRGSNAINIKGTGLGLNIVRQYLDIMDGQIYFESVENQGSCFSIAIPLKTE